MGSLMIVMIMATTAVAAMGNEYSYADPLSYSYYHASCPQLESIINNRLTLWLKNDSTLAPSLLNLHFHDCIVRGCDASILLNHKGSERTSEASKSLRGFDLIDDIKSEVEKACPRTVSCADILTAAARDATVASGGPYWTVPYGRKDGRISAANEAEESVPTGRERITNLIQLFQSKGLDILDLVVLSGAHTIGRSRCGCVQPRLFDRAASGGQSMNLKYRNFLRRKCRWASEYVELDAVTPKGFDVQYYKNLENKMGLLTTDQLMYNDSRTKPLVAAFASESAQFHHQFAASMLKLGRVQDYLLEEHDEVRVNCNVVNAK